MSNPPVELKVLREQISEMSNSIEGMKVLKEQISEMCNSIEGMKVLKDQISEMSNSIEGMKAKIQKLGGEVEEEEEKKKKNREADKTGRSGFRRCKPEGTFLWPSRNGLNSMSQLQAEDFLMVPTPTSVTSTLPWEPRQPSSPAVKPQPKIVSVAQADNCKRKVFCYSRSMSMIASSAAYAVSGSVSLSSAHHDMLLLPLLSHPGPGESPYLLSDVVSYGNGSTVTSANPPQPPAAPAAAASPFGSWLSL